MRFFTAILACGLLVSSTLAAPQQQQYAPQQQQQYAGYNPYLSNPMTTTPAPILHPPAQVHYVNIGQELNGDYKFGYDTGKGPSGQSFREETRLPDGTVKGQYGYLDRENKMRIVKYTAGLQGFQIDSDTALSDQQLQASRAAPAEPQQRAPQQAPQASSYYQPQAISKPPAYQGLASAASSQPASIAQYSHPAQYNPTVSQFNPSAYAPAGGPPSAPYTGYAAAPQAYAPNYSVNPSVPGYPPRTLTPDQIRQNNALNARARQAALARQQQQEALIRQQQQAATEAILAQQKAAVQAEAAAQQAAAQSQYSGPAAYNQYQQAQPQYQQAPQQQYAPQYQQSNYASPVTASAASAATAPAPQAQAPSYGPRHTASELKPDLLSNFIQLPGVRLIQLDKKPTQRPSSSAYPSSNSFGLTAGQTPTTPGSPGSGVRPDEEYQGPVVINAALLNYNIGANQPATPAPSKAAAAKAKA